MAIQIMADKQNHHILVQYLHTHSTMLDPEPTQLNPRLGKISGIRAVVFDVYGTLFISASGDISFADPTARESAAKQAWQDAGFAQLGILPDGLTQEFITHIKKRHNEMKSRGNDFPEIIVTDVWQTVISELCGFIPDRNRLELFALAYETHVNPVWPMPGLNEVLDFLGGRKMITGIISNAQFFTPLLFPALTGKTLEEWGIKDSFCQWSYVLERAKPDPKMFLNLLSDLNECYTIDASEVLYIGNDMLNDILTASSCNMRTALFAGDRRSLRMREDMEKCRDLQPDAVLTDLLQIREVLA